MCIASFSKMHVNCEKLLHNHPMAVEWQRKRVCQPSDPYYPKPSQNIAFNSVPWTEYRAEHFLCLPESWVKDSTKNF